MVVVETDEDSYFVFANPEKIVDMVRQLIGSKDLLRRRFERGDALRLEGRLLSKSGLDILWEKKWWTLARFNAFNVQARSFKKGAIPERRVANGSTGSAFMGHRRAVKLSKRNELSSLTCSHLAWSLTNSIGELCGQ